MRKEITTFKDGEGTKGDCDFFFSGGSTHCLANSFPWPMK